MLFSSGPGGHREWQLLMGRKHGTRHDLAQYYNAGKTEQSGSGSGDRGLREEFAALRNSG